MHACISIGQVRTNSDASSKSSTQQYLQAVQQQVNSGNFDGFLCGSPEHQTEQANNPDRAPCAQNELGYGTNCWSPTSGLPSNRDATCSIPAMANSSCGLYKVPIAIVVFENTAWTGSNYLNGTGFVQLPDADLTAMVTNLNNVYQNANMQFYECKPRQRINNADLYNFYSSASDPDDGVNDENESTAFDTPDVITLYFVGGLSGDHDCCGYLGYAYFPPSRDFAVMRYAAANGPIVAHELGHYFGLYHTNRNLPTLTGGDATGTPSDALNNCDCLTKGDGICDTYPDPNFTHTCPTSCGGGTCYITGNSCDFSETGYACVNNGAALTINPSAGVDVGTGMSTILEKNFMSSNQLSNCRNAFSPCQFRKMHDVLLNCRSYLCYADVTQDFNSTVLNAADSPYKEICVGDPAPTFTAKSACYKWFADATGGGATPLFTGASFTPTIGTGAGQLNNNLIGIQDFWVEDVNKYHSPACRRQVTVRVVPRPGTTPSISDTQLCCNETITFNSNGVNIDTCNQTIGWWRTTTPFANYAAAEVAYNALTATQRADQIKSSTTFNGSTATFNFTNACTLSPGTYYMTPFVSRRAKAAVSSVTLVDNVGTTTNGNFNGLAAHRFNTGALAGVPAIDPCNPRPAPTFTITINVTATNQTNLNFDFHPANNCSSTTPRYLTNNPTNSNGNGGVGTFTFTQAQMPAFDPALGFCFWIYSNSGALTASFTVSVTVVYPGINEVAFPSFERACSLGTTTAFTVLGPVVAPTSSNRTVCQGAATTLTASGVSGNQYVWYGPNSTTTVAQAASTSNTFAPNVGAGTYTYYVSQINTGGCESSKTAVTLTVNAAPSATITNAQTGCGSPILDAGAGAGKQYAWSTGANTQTINANNIGTYTVTVTQNACTNSGSFTVTALGLQATANSNSPICTGSDLNLSSSGGTSYAWAGPNGFSAATQNPTINAATSAASGVYTVTVTGNNVGTTCTATATLSVTVDVVNATATNTSPVCSGSNVSLSATGGATYAWSGPAAFSANTATATVTAVTANKVGIYTVTVTTASGCVSTASTTLSLGGPTATAASNTPCLGAAINLTSGGGVTYAWAGPNSFTSSTQNPTISNANTAKAGTYTVTVTDANGCTATATTLVAISTVTATAANNGPLCAGATINLTSGGGVTYAWAGPNSFTSATQNPTVNNVNAAKAGIYTVTVTNANGCTATATTKVVLQPTVTATAANSGAVCQGGTVTLTGSSTTTGVTYAWSGPNSYTASTQNPALSNIQAVSAGVYTVTVTATATGCTATATTTVLVGATSANITSNSPVCTNGTILLSTTATGTYSWSGPNGFTSNQQSPIIINATTANNGTYSLTVTAANGCAAVTSAVVTVSSIAVTASSNSPVCRFSNLDLTANGGGTYSWSGPNSFTSALQNPSFALNNTVQTGIYTVSVTAAGGACSATATTVVSMSNPSATANNNSPTCQGGTTILNATSNETVTSYAWAGTNGYTANVQTPSISNIQTAQAGVYTVTITSSTGCTRTATTTVTVNAVSAAAASNSPVCTNTTLSLNTPNVTGATYSWSGPNGFTSTLRQPSVSNATAANAGVYSVTVTGTNGCTAVSSTTVSVGSLVATATSNSPVCVGTTLQLGTTAGTSYAWAGPGGFTSTQQNPTRNNMTTARAGVYTVTVTSGGCTATATVTVSVVSVTATAASNSPVCNGNALNLTSSGGTAYAWAGQNGFTSTAQNPSIASFATANAGVYTVTVSNGNCASTATTTVSGGVSVTVSAAVNNPICLDGAINLTATATGGNLVINGDFSAGNSGFSSDYTFVNSRTSTAQYGVGTNASSWYSFLSGNCTGFGGSGNMYYADAGSNATARVWYQTIAVTPNTNYEVSAMAQSVENGTPARLVFRVGNTTIGSQVNVGTTACQWVPMSATFNSGTSTSVVLSIRNAETNTSGNNFALDNIVCRPALTYAWEGPSGYTASTQNPTRSNATTAMSGTYTVTVSGANICSATATVSVNVGAGAATATNNSPVCAGGTISLSAGSGGSSYAWAGPSGYTASTQNPTRSNATTAMAGTYTVTVTNTGSCSGTATTVVTVNTAAATATNGGAACAGGTVTLNATGGGTYVWAGPSGFSANVQSPSITVMSTAKAGVYTVTVTAANGCTATATTTAVLSTATATATSNSPVAIGGTMNLNSSGGVSYAWSGPDGFTASTQNPTRSNATTAMAGTYIVTVTNSVGCTATAAVNVSVNTVTATATSNSPICVGATLQLNATGGLSYAWSGPASFSSNQQNPTRTSMTTARAGIYTVTVTAANGTTATATTNVVVSNLTLSPDFNEVVCDGDNLELYANASGTVSTIQWTGPDGTSSSQLNPILSNATNDYEGTWTVTATNSAGCTDTETLDVWINQVHGYIQVDGDAWQNNSSYYICRWDYLEMYADNYDNDTESVYWTGPNGVSSNGQYVGVTIPSTAYTGTYTAYITDQYDCTEAVSIYLTVVNCGGKEGQNLSDVLANSEDVWLHNAPNPFSQYTQISFALPNAGRASLQLFDVMGRNIATLFDDTAEANKVYSLELKSGDLPSGVYFVQMVNEMGVTSIHKMELVR